MGYFILCEWNQNTLIFRNKLKLLAHNPQYFAPEDLC